MVGCLYEQDIDEDLNTVDSKINDLSFVDAFLDFDAIEGWYQDSEAPVEEKVITMDEGGLHLEELPVADVIKPNEMKSESIEFDTENISTFGIAEKMEKVNLLEDGVKCEPVSVVDKADSDNDERSSSELDSEDVSVDKAASNNDERSSYESASESSSASSSDSDSSSDEEDKKEEIIEKMKGQKEICVDEVVSNVGPSKLESESSSSSSSSDEEYKNQEFMEPKEKMKGKKEIHVDKEVRNVREEGEISDEEVTEIERRGKGKVSWSDVELDDADENDGTASGPIRSKNETQILPPVPPILATLQPDHQLLPVGTVLSIMGTKVIVEGAVHHNPLNEGSILWIAETRSPLGIIDEIFGPVKNPYYVVRYNAENEVPTEIREGALISFVQDFAHHILNEKNLYNKGYDASGENDEELSDDLEFSDDEKEAEYRRMRKLNKRGIVDQNVNRNVKNREGNWTPKRELSVNQNRAFPNQAYRPPQSPNQAYRPPQSPNTSVFPPTYIVGVNPTMPQQFPQNNTPFPPPWINRMPFQQYQNPNSVPWHTQTQVQNPNRMPYPVQMPFQPLYSPMPGLIPNMGYPGGQPNMFPGFMVQPGFRMPFPGQFNVPGQCINIAEQGSSSNVTNNNIPQQPLIAVQGNFQSPQQFNCGGALQQSPADVQGNFQTTQQFNGGRAPQLQFDDGGSAQQFINGGNSNNNIPQQSPVAVQGNFQSTQQFNGGRATQQQFDHGGSAQQFNNGGNSNNNTPQQPPVAVQGNFQATQQFNGGGAAQQQFGDGGSAQQFDNGGNSTRGRGTYQGRGRGRGRGRFGGRRGRQHRR